MVSKPHTATPKDGHARVVNGPRATAPAPSPSAGPMVDATGPQAGNASDATTGKHFPSIPDEQTLMAQLALRYLNDAIDDMDYMDSGAEAAPPMQSVSVVHKSEDGQVISERKTDLGASFKLLPLDPAGVLKPVDLQTEPDGRDLAIPAGVHPTIISPPPPPPLPWCYPACLQETSQMYSA